MRKSIPCESHVSGLRYVNINMFKLKNTNQRRVGYIVSIFFLGATAIGVPCTYGLVNLRHLKQIREKTLPIPQFSDPHGADCGRSRGSNLISSSLLKDRHTTPLMFSTMMTGTPDYVAILGNDEDYPDDYYKALSFMSTAAQSSLPIESRDLILQVTNQYVYGSNTVPSMEPIDVMEIITEDHMLRTRIPVTLGNVTFDSTSSGRRADDQVATVLSFATMYQLPKEITQQLLSWMEADEGSTREFSACRKLLAMLGWEAVTFPRGIALEKKDTLKSQPKGLQRLLIGRRSHRRKEDACLHVQAASKMQAPLQRLQTREEFLRKVDAQLTQLTHSTSMDRSPSNRRDDLLFFPSSTTDVPNSAVSFLNEIRRRLRKQQKSLQSYGRAGLVAYSFLNFVFYSVGVVWQWRRIALADPLTTHSAASVVILRKIMHVFASVYIGSQIFQVVKVLGAIAMAPFAQRVLSSTSSRLRTSESVACVGVLAILVLVWLGLVAVPALADYAALRKLLDFDEKLIQMYASQPV